MTNILSWIFPPELKTIIILAISFLIIAISSNQIAKIFQKIKLPLITGLIFTGILAGPYLLNLVPLTSTKSLSFINDMALAFIAFAAGSELYLRELRGQIESIKWNTFGQLIVTFLLGIILLVFASSYLPFMTGKDMAAKIAIASITASVFVARSPASAIAVINELRAKGPFTQTVMGVTVVKDFLVIVLFSICLSVGISAISGTAFNFTAILILIGELILSFVVGFYAFGSTLKLALSFRLQRTVKCLLVLLVGYSAYAFTYLLGHLTEENLSLHFSTEPLLMCILASLNVTNYSKYRPEFLKILHDLSIPVYVAFFTYTGASLQVNVIGQVIGVALILFFIRLITIIIGSYVGGFLAKDPSSFNNVGWMPYVTQAGVALGLTTVVASEFPDWGPAFSTAIVALIVINQMIGPPLFKYAIFKLGEDRIRGKGLEEDGINNAMIFGFESQSLALARQLKNNGWNAQITTLQKKGLFPEPEDIPILYVSKLTGKEIESLGMDKMDAVVTMLSDRENLNICEIAYHEYGTKDIIVRLNNRENSPDFLALGVLIVEPSTAIVSLLDHFVRSPQATSLLLGMEKGQDTQDIRLSNTSLHGITLRDLRLPSDLIILSVTRAGQSIISHGYTRLRIGDIVTVVGSVKSMNEVQFKFNR